MRNGGLAEAVFTTILRRTLFDIVVRRCRERERTRRMYVIAPCTPTSRLECPHCQKYILSARYTQHLSKCLRKG